MLSRPSFDRHQPPAGVLQLIQKWADLADAAARGAVELPHNQLMRELTPEVTIVIVTHNLQEARRVAAFTAF